MQEGAEDAVPERHHAAASAGLQCEKRNGCAGPQRLDFCKNQPLQKQNPKRIFTFGEEEPFLMKNCLFCSGQGLGRSGAGSARCSASSQSHAREKGGKSLFVLHRTQKQ